MSDDPSSPTPAARPAVQEDIPSDSGGSAVDSGTVTHDPVLSSVDVDDDDDDVRGFQWTGSPLSREYRGDFPTSPSHDEPSAPLPTSLPVGRAKLTTAPSRPPKTVRDKAKTQYKPNRPPSIPAQAWETFTTEQQIAYWDDIFNQAEQAQL